MPLNRAYYRHKCYRKFGANTLGRESTATEILATGITDPYVIQSTSDNVAQKEHWRGFRPNQSDESRNRHKTMGRSTGNTLLIGDGTTYSVGTLSDTAWELLPPDIHPDDDLNAALEEAPHLLYFPAEVPNAIFRDGDCSSPSGAAFQAFAGTIDIAATAVARYNDSGFNSKLWTFSEANSLGGPVTPAFVLPGQRIMLFASIIPVSGMTEASPVTFEIWNDRTDARMAGTTLRTLWARTPQMVGEPFTVPPGCDAVSFRIGNGSNTNAVLAVDCIPSVNLSEFRQPLPSYTDSPVKLLSVAQASYRQQVSAGIYAARSRVLAAWKAGSDFRPEGLRADTVDPRVQVLNPEWVAKGQIPEADIWYSVLRPWSDRCPFDSDTRESLVREELMTQACYYTVGNMLAMKRKTQAFAQIIGEAKAALDSQFKAEIPVQAPEDESFIIPGGRPGRFSRG